MARLPEFDCIIYVPSDMVDERRRAIESKGAKLVVVDGSYDEAVRLCASKEKHVISGEVL